MANLNELLKVVVAHKRPEKNPKIYIDIFTNIRVDDIIDNTKRKPIIPIEHHILEIGIGKSFLERYKSKYKV
jgi:hypothetical protein